MDDTQLARNDLTNIPTDTNMTRVESCEADKGQPVVRE